MKKSYIHSINYNDWANEQLIRFLQTNKDYPLRCIDLISHIISAQDYWFDRLINKSIYLVDLWEKYTLIEMLPLSQNSTSSWRNFVNKIREKDFTELCGYYNEKGIAVDISTGDVINHVLNHSAYHRGQINMLFKNDGITPVDIDFRTYASF